MPTYDYECDACGQAFEMFQSMKASPIRKCPKCGKLKVRRLIGTGAGIIFKGSGFYQTDYRSESYRQAAQKDKAPAAASTEAAKGASAGAKPSEAAKPAESAKAEPAKPSDGKGKHASKGST